MNEILRRTFHVFCWPCQRLLLFSPSFATPGNHFAEQNHCGVPSSPRFLVSSLGIHYVVFETGTVLKRLGRTLAWSSFTMAGLFRNSAFGTFLMAFLVSIHSGWSTPVRHTETSPYQSPEPRTTTLPIDEYELLSLGNIQDRWTTTASGRQCCEHRCRSCRAARRRVSGTRNIYLCPSGAVLVGWWRRWRLMRRRDAEVLARSP